MSEASALLGALAGRTRRLTTDTPQSYSGRRGAVTKIRRNRPTARDLPVGTRSFLRALISERKVHIGGSAYAAGKIARLILLRFGAVLSTVLVGENRVKEEFDKESTGKIFRGLLKIIPIVILKHLIATGGLYEAPLAIDVNLNNRLAGRRGAAAVAGGGW